MATNRSKIEEAVESIRINNEKLISDITLPFSTKHNTPKKDNNVKQSYSNNKSSSLPKFKTQRNGLGKNLNKISNEINNKKTLKLFINKQNGVKKDKRKSDKCISANNVNNNYITERSNGPLCNRVEQSIVRFNEQKKLREEKNKQLQEKYLKEENIICNKTKKVTPKEAEKMKGNFIQRLKKKEEEVKEKKDRLQLEKKIKEEIIDLQQQIPKKEKKKKEVILKQINEMLEWNEKRKEKIQTIKSLEEIENEIFIKQSFKPKICPNSKKIASKHFNRSTENAFDRLYNDEEKRQQKRAVMQTLYQPSFTPVLNKKKSNDELPNQTITINDYSDLATNVNIEELFRNKIYQKRKNRTVESGEYDNPEKNHPTPLFNNSKISKYSQQSSHINSPRRRSTSKSIDSNRSQSSYRSINSYNSRNSNESNSYRNSSTSKKKSYNSKYSHSSRESYNNNSNGSERYSDSNRSGSQERSNSYINSNSSKQSYSSKHSFPSEQ